MKSFVLYDRKSALGENLKSSINLFFLLVNFFVFPFANWSIKYMFSSPSISEIKAILSPFEDHTGSSSLEAELKVNCLISPYFAGAENISPLAENTTLFPVGEISNVVISFWGFIYSYSGTTLSTHEGIIISFEVSFFILSLYIPLLHS